jgi:hypothetical protein
MTPEKIDYIAILNDMKAKRAALDASIVALEAALASGTLGQAVEGVSSGIGTMGLGSPGTPMDLPSGAFNGKTLPEGIKLYLSAARQRKSTRDITNGIREGGMVSTSQNFESVVQATLQKLKSQGHVLKFADGWGLSEWYPAGFRSAGKNPKAAKSAKAGNKKGRPTVKPLKRTKEPKATKVSAQPKPSAGDDGAGVEHRIEKLLLSDKAKTFTIAEISSTIGIGAKGTPLILGRLAKKNKAEKAAGGYRAFSVTA